MNKYSIGAIIGLLAIITLAIAGPPIKNALFPEETFTPAGSGIGEYGD